MDGPGIEIDVDLVRRLVAGSFPEWADLSVTAVSSIGTDNAIFRLGEELSVRLPRVARAAETTAKEQRWLPRFDGRLPLPIPMAMGLGEPGEGYPWAWGVALWIEGRDASAEPIPNGSDPAIALADFLAALQRVDPLGGPSAGEHNNWRGVALKHLDARVRHCLDELTADIDTAAALAIWQDALAAPPHDRAPVWIHGDLHPGNLVVRDQGLAGVIDFGLLALGDPAVDLMAAWTVFDVDARASFLHRLAADEALVRRARGWALYSGAVALPYYRDSNPALAAISRRTLAAVLAD
ncbi:MAG: aminoglycoside phosphotransferase family protein [Caulobacter sp.]|nr:aminoglycoside phosphotransferase family protein [Caulobacter sp.]